jgi:hypothetical protein
MFEPFCGPERDTGTSVGVGTAVGASVAGKEVAVTTINCGVGVAPHADKTNVSIRMVATITYRAFFIQSPSLALVARRTLL